jgi:hypothetical protein
MLDTVHHLKIFKMHGVSEAESASVARNKLGKGRSHLGPLRVHLLRY